MKILVIIRKWNFRKKIFIIQDYRVKNKILDKGLAYSKKRIENHIKGKYALLLTENIYNRWAAAVAVAAAVTLLVEAVTMKGNGEFL